MPIYEYQCDACGNQFETMQKMTEQPLTDCETCGKPKLRKLISAVAFRLKGSGWYETDFKNNGKRADKDDTPDTDGASKSNSASESSDGTTASSTDENTKKDKPVDAATNRQNDSRTSSSATN